MDVEEVQNVKHLIEFTQYLDPLKWIFRGVADESFALTPSIGRTRPRRVAKPTVRTALGQREVREHFSSDHERALLERFKDQSRPHLSHLHNNLEWLVYGQHHGLPTRLLDWSRSPLVAAFFATERTMVVKEYVENFDRVGKQRPLSVLLPAGAIYAVELPQPAEPTDFEDPFVTTEIRSVVPAHVSPRIVQQSGVLTLHGSPRHKWDLEPTNAKKYSIPYKQKLYIREHLAQLGIHSASLFPGVEGIAAYLKWQFEWDRVL